MKNFLFKKSLIFIAVIIFLFSLNVNVKAYDSNVKIVKNAQELKKSLQMCTPGTTLLLEDGTYKDVKLDINSSGTEDNPIIIKSKNPGQAILTGDSKISIHADYIILEGLYFKNGNRNQRQWGSHVPGLIGIYGDYNRITQCAIHNFDNIDSAWITTSIDSITNHVPQYNRIDHCSFTGKTSKDQVINLNNSKDKNGQGTAMYNRIDHCYFSNPKKTGNAGGAIRVGYYINDVGRCLIDHNLFEKQDSEAEIITSKSKENVYLNNTIRNSQGTLNFRHGSNQVAIGNYFIGNDNKAGYGGMFVWGANHVIANNYFSLNKTMNDRGNAALYLNPGIENSEHSLAYNLTIANNIFVNNNGSGIHLDALYSRRFSTEPKTKHPHNNTIINNIFYSENKTNLAFKDDFPNIQRNDTLENNIVCRLKSGYGVGKTNGIENKNFSMLLDNDIYKLDSSNNINTNKSIFSVQQIEGMQNIPGLEFNLDLDKLAHTSVYSTEPLTFKDVCPDWLTSVPAN